MLKELKEADYVIITAGAGMGVDSGLPDFRGNEGFWRAYPPLKKLNIDFVSMANPMWFRENPKLAWAFYGHRLNLYRNTTPHEGFRLLLEYAKSKKDYFVFTSNVDGQFQKAGFDEDKIYEVHGSIHYTQCNDCGIIKEIDFDIEVDMGKFKAKNLPYCECGNLLRPNILMFWDMDFLSDRINKQKEKFDNFLKIAKAYKNNKIVIIEIGAGVAILTIRDFGDKMSYSDRVTLIRINPRDYQVKNGISIPMGGLEGIKRILE